MSQIGKFLIATSNPGKFSEIYSVLKDLEAGEAGDAGGVGGNLAVDSFTGPGFTFFSSKDLGLSDDFDEVGETHEEVAMNKAKFYFEQVDKGISLGSAQPRGFNYVLAEDSGIIVDEIKGELGVKTRRWGAGEKATDGEWIEYFLERMKSVPAEKRTARFICCAVLINRDGDAMLFRGETEGIITASLQAPIKAGLPLSSCFIPEGFDKVYAEMTDKEKALISHRGRAIYQVRDFLKTR